ncbi:peptide-n4-(n-acetyl-beta- glucosaminyl)asparagine amidase a [Quercus suber]|uniref:Peptide-n4-(N-acetyl-beta-glucosaminyl)asparagine amidase a n=1 Tax=Quercus suber TaxID=58331 RepID=A0AAW0IWD1_QUESU
MMGCGLKLRVSTDIALSEFKIPQNAYRAVLEVYVSFHENDEFWYSNFYNEYIEANNLTGAAGNGPFREVLVSLDGQVVVQFGHLLSFLLEGLIPSYGGPLLCSGKMPSSSVYSTESHKKFDLYLYYNELDDGNGTSVSLENVTLGFLRRSLRMLVLDSQRALSEMCRMDRAIWL